MKRLAVLFSLCTACGGAPIQTGTYDVHSLLVSNTCNRTMPSTAVATWRFSELSDGYLLTVMESGLELTSENGHEFKGSSFVTVDTCRVDEDLTISLENNGNSFSGDMVDDARDCHDRTCKIVYDLSGSLQ